MSDPIKAGDWVVVVKPTMCCGNTTAIGWVFEVAEVALQKGMFCTHCNHRGEWDAARNDRWDGFELSRLKRIPPLSELDDVNLQEEVHA